jgi:signal transduction histidine kinase
MDHLQQVRHMFSRRTFWALTGGQTAAFATLLALKYLTMLPFEVIVGISYALGILLGLWITEFITNYVAEPLQAIWQAILHLNPEQQGIAAPQTDSLRVGKELVASLTAQVYQLANLAEHASTTALELKADLKRSFIAQNLPLPLFVLDATETIIYSNIAAAQYIGINNEDMRGKNIYMVLDMSFPSNDTFDNWLKSVKGSKATATNSWERVKLNIRDDHPTRLFDLAAYYNKDNPEHNETMLVLFDHTQEYSQDEQAVSFVALSVHELRTPLTLLRGYIEVFQEELSGKVDTEMQGFMQKMQSQAEQLTAFVNNILNVARVDDDQLELHLQQEDWGTILKEAVDTMSLRAKVRGITLKCSVQTNLPTVGADRLSIREVINNLIDNAIKYTGDSKVIEINSALNADGFIETTVKDYGLGISNSIMSNLFTKFYRDHRNRAQIGGTGLGLYLSKAIVDAHGGSIWVRSKENEGSTFGFTLVPYARMSEDLKKSGNQELTRSAHGWIKNHSLYRR